MENYDSCLSGPWSLPQGKVLPNLNKALIVDVCPVWSRISLGILHYRGTLGTNIKMEWDRFLHIDPLVHLPIHSSTYPTIPFPTLTHPSIHLSTYWSSIYPLIYLLTHPTIHSFTLCPSTYYPSIYLFIHPSIILLSMRLEVNCSSVGSRAYLTNYCDREPCKDRITVVAYSTHAW